MPTTATNDAATASCVADVVMAPTARTPTAGSPSAEISPARMPHTGMPKLGQLAGLALPSLLQLRDVIGGIGGVGRVCGPACFIRRIPNGGKLVPTTRMPRAAATASGLPDASATTVACMA